MNPRERDTHSVSFHDGGGTARPFPLCLAVVGEVFVLTSPFIERDYRNVSIRATHPRATFRQGDFYRELILRKHLLPNDV